MLTAGVARRPARAPARVRDRARAVHGRLAAVRTRAQRGRPRPLPRRAGHRRGGHVLDRAGPARPGVPRPRTGHGARDLGGDDRRRGGRRAAGGRRAHRGDRVGVDLLRQRPDRDRRDRADPLEGAGVAGPGRTRHRLGGCGDLERGAVPVRVRAHQGQRRGLGQHGDRLLPRRLPRAAAHVLRVRAAPGTPDARSQPVPQAELRGRVGRGLRAVGLDVRDVPLPHPLSPEHPRVLTAGDRRALPAADRRSPSSSRRSPGGFPSGCPCAASSAAASCSSASGWR